MRTLLAPTILLPAAGWAIGCAAANGGVKMLGIAFRTFGFLACYIAGSSCMLGCIGYINDPHTFPGREPCRFLGQEIWSGSRIQSITIGDFNGDSRPDVGVRTSEDLSVLLNTGGGNFTSPIRTELRYGSALASVTDYGGGRTEAAADFNDDGKLDLVIKDRNELLFGVGDGTFLPPQAIRGEYPTFYGLTTTGDFNADHKPDLVFFVRGSLAILLGNGDGTFRLGSTAEFGPDGQLLVADFNRDGWSDLAYLHYGPDGPGWPSSRGGLCCDLRIFLGQGDGAFQEQARMSEIAAGGILAAHFNDDGMLDIATANSVLLGKGDGSFQAHQSFLYEAPGTPAGPAAAADLDGDARVDLVNLDTSELRSIYTLLGNSDGTVALANPSSHWLYLWEPVDRRVGGIADLDGDGRPDLVTAVFGGGDGHVLPIPSAPVASSVMILLNRVEGAPR